ncbi:MAG: hypothetical protein WCO00_00545 [Rhodospirillaceae bacterium]
MLAIRNPTPGSIADLHGRLGRDRRTSQKFYSLAGREDHDGLRVAVNQLAAFFTDFN